MDNIKKRFISPQAIIIISRFCQEFWETNPVMSAAKPELSHRFRRI